MFWFRSQKIPVFGPLRPTRDLCFPRRTGHSNSPQRAAWYHFESPTTSQASVQSSRSTFRQILRYAKYISPELGHHLTDTSTVETITQQRPQP